jgi:SAM-dependent methyltransferase
MSDLVTDERSHFNGLADLYDRSRPGYPPLLFDDLELFSRLPPSARILDVGCGTGKSTEGFARRGYRIVALDLGAQMLDLCRKNLQHYRNVTFELGSFETWDSRGAIFDLIISGTAFHWVASESQQRVKDLLTPQGCIGIFWHTFLNGQEDIFQTIQQIYKVHFPESCATDLNMDLETFDRRREIEVMSLAGFASWRVIRYYTTLRLSAREYVGLMRTWSTHRTAKEPLYEEVAQAIEQNGGEILKPIRTTLCFAERETSA